jgi:hypothetical protein
MQRHPEQEAVDVSPQCAAVDDPIFRERYQAQYQDFARVSSLLALDACAGFTLVARGSADGQAVAYYLQRETVGPPKAAPLGFSRR